MKYRIKRICHNDPSLDRYIIQRKKFLLWENLDMCGNPNECIIKKYYTLEKAEEAMRKFISELEISRVIVKTVNV